MDRWVGKVAVVTGASSGIGLAISKYLVKEGMIVIGLARRKYKMQEAMKTVKGKGKFFSHQCDISEEVQVEEVFSWIKRTLGGVHVLVNNAGLMIPGKTLEVGKDVWNKTIGVNLMGLLYCTRDAVKIMKESGLEGHVININSILGHRILRGSGLHLNIYPSTKHAVTALTTTLELELLGSKIRCTSISPGLVQTEIFEANNEDKTIGEKLSQLPVLLSEDVAEAVVYILGTHPRVQITELTIQPLGELF